LAQAAQDQVSLPSIHTLIFAPRTYKMARFMLALPFLVALPSTTALRKSVQQAGNGPHKCIINWEVPERGVASVSFPVSSCRIKCKPTFTDNHYDRVFAAVFALEQDGKTCKCTNNGSGDVIKFFGSCDGAKVQDKCFHDYKVLRTNTYKRDPGRETSYIVRHPELYDEKTFSYTQCEENACKDGNCTSAEFPSIMAGRSADEKKIIADLLKKIARGDGKDLSGDDKNLVDAMTSDDVGEIMYSDIISSLDDSAGGVLTVGKLREIYNEKLISTGISTDHLVAVAGFTDDSEEVDLDGFKRFVQPDCD